jgi:hypothetical protein
LKTKEQLQEKFTVLFVVAFVSSTIVIATKFQLGNVSGPSNLRLAAEIKNCVLQRVIVTAENFTIVL